MKLTLRCLAALAAAFLVSTQSAHAISLGQIDTFQDGTTNEWANGGGAPLLVNVTTGGPAGLNDRYLQMSSTGIAGAGGRLTMFNFNQWTGNYITAGVTAIQLDLRNEGNVQLSIRLGFKTDSGPTASGYMTPAIVLAPGSGWQRFTVAITPGSLITVGTPQPYNVFFANNFAELRIFHSVGTSNLNGDFIAGQLGIDNVRAVPEPATTALLGGGLLMVGAGILRRRRRTAQK